MMIEIASGLALVGVSVSILLTSYRLAVGPGAPDRVLALDTLVINGIALVVVAGILFNTMLYFEVALFFAMVGFVTTVAYCKYLLRGNVID